MSDRTIAFLFWCCAVLWFIAVVWFLVSINIQRRTHQIGGLLAHSESR
jgi:hypothetical protein